MLSEMQLKKYSLLPLAALVTVRYLHDTFGLSRIRYFMLKFRFKFSFWGSRELGCMTLQTLPHALNVTYFYCF